MNEFLELEDRIKDKIQQTKQESWL